MNTKINRGYFPVVLLSYDEICGRLYYNIVISKTLFAAVFYGNASYILFYMCRYGGVTDTYLSPIQHFM